MKRYRIGDLVALRFRGIEIQGIIKALRGNLPVLDIGSRSDIVVIRPEILRLVI